MRPEEGRALAIIEAVLPGTRMQYRDEQSQGQHDFDLERADGTIVPVEVTRAADAQMESTYAAIQSRKHGGAWVRRVAAQFDWYVHPLASARIDAVRRDVDRHLAAIEADGLHRFFAYTDGAESNAVLNILETLGIEAGRVMQWKSPGYHRIALPGSGGFVDTQAAVDAVESEAWKADNRRKLGSSALERHLFVEIDPNNYLAWVSIRDQVPPCTIPSLPPEVTHVWAAGFAGTEDCYVVWHARRDATWVHLGSVNVRTGERSDRAV